jgi:hypothetical protein
MKTQAMGLLTTTGIGELTTTDDEDSEEEFHTPNHNAGLGGKLKKFAASRSMKRDDQ